MGRDLSLLDWIKIRERIIGTESIGEETAGLLLARAILVRSDSQWSQKLEEHDFFYLGANVLSAGLVRKDGREEYHGWIDSIERLQAMLHDWGSSPIMLSLDGPFENDCQNPHSMYCTNQGSAEERWRDFWLAVRAIYFGTSRDSVPDRATPGILRQNDEIGLLVRRASGMRYGVYFYPHISGIGYSYNPYVWNRNIDPRAGVVRLVFGLETRMRERTDDDYTRVVALNEPMLRPETGAKEIRRYSQRKADGINLENRTIETLPVSELMQKSPGLPTRWFVAQEEERTWLGRDGDFDAVRESPFSLDDILTRTGLVSDLQRLMETLEETYETPVEIRFTANFTETGEPKINLLQCRPVHKNQVRSISTPHSPSSEKQVILNAAGAVIGHSRSVRVDRMIYVVPSVYGDLPIRDRYSIARCIGKIMRVDDPDSPKTLLLLGPGRWGTTTPSLGVPVAFAEIKQASILGEIESMREDLIPDVSLGAHFFSDLVERDILYFALFPKREGNDFREDLLWRNPNRLGELLPDAERYADVIRVMDFPNERIPNPIVVCADVRKQNVCFYWKR